MQSESLMELLNANESFTEAYNRYIKEQIKGSSAERKRKLLDPNRYAETLFLLNVWWPAFGGFRRLHAEYEVRDFKDGWRYLDFVYKIHAVRICIEIDPFGTHFRNIDRNKYDDGLLRHNDLQVDDWRILRFSLDMIRIIPRQCQQFILSALAKWGLEEAAETTALPLAEYAIWKWVYSKEEAIPPITVARAFGIDRKTASRHMKALSMKGFLHPVTSLTGKHMKYRAHNQEK